MVLKFYSPIPILIILYHSHLFSHAGQPKVYIGTAQACQWHSASIMTVTWLFEERLMFQAVPTEAFKCSYVYVHVEFRHYITHLAHGNLM